MRCSDSSRSLASSPLPGPGCLPRPRPTDVTQPFWHTTCHITVALQAVAARYPAYLAGMLEPRPGSFRVRHHGLAKPITLDVPGKPRYVPAAEVASGHTTVCSARADVHRDWPRLLRDAYCVMSRHRHTRQFGYPDCVLFWALGCQVHSDVLLPGAARVHGLNALAAMFTAGECVVLFVGKHCWSLVGVDLHEREATGRWRLTFCDPRAWKRTFSFFSDEAAVLTKIYAYSVTMGAARAARASDF